MIYFIQQGEDGPIKIGHTEHGKDGVNKRLVSLQTGSPYPLRLLCTTKGGVNMERAYHRLFGDARLVGEWFSPTKDLVDLVKLHKQNLTYHVTQHCINIALGGDDKREPADCNVVTFYKKRIRELNDKINEMEKAAVSNENKNGSRDLFLNSLRKECHWNSIPTPGLFNRLRREFKERQNRYLRGMGVNV